MVAITILPIIALLAIGLLTLIIVAIVRKKWALLFIPLGIAALLFIAIISLRVSHAPARVVHVNTQQYTQHDGNAQAIHGNPEDVYKDFYQPSTHQETVSSETAQVAEYSLDGNVKITQPHTHAAAGVLARSSVRDRSYLKMITFMAIIALFILMIFAIVRKKWALLLIPLGVGAFAFVGLFGFKAVSTNSHARQYGSPQNITQTATSVTPYDAARENPLPAVWSPGMEKEFQADVYYSKSSALRGIAARVDKLVREMALNGKTVPPQLALLTYKDQFTAGLLDEAVAIFQETLPDTECFTVSAGKESFTNNDSWISFELTESSAPADGHLDSCPNKKDFKKGSIKASIHLKSVSTTVTATFTDKPWLDNFSAFKNSIPQKQFAIAYSQTSSRSNSQATRDAMTRAQQIVKQRIFDIMPQADQGITMWQSELNSHGIIVDNFTQSFNGSSERIHRHALLLDISPDRIMPLARQKISGYNLARQSWAYHILSAIGIAVVICVIYLLLNAATRGYYTVVLRIITIAGIIATIILILNLA